MRYLGRPIAAAGLAAAMAACQPAGAPDGDGPPQSRRLAFDVGLVANRAAQILVVPGQQPRFVLGDDALSRELDGLPASACRQVGAWRTCFAKTGAAGTGVARRADGARCIHGGRDAANRSTSAFADVDVARSSAAAVESFGGLAALCESLA